MSSAADIAGQYHRILAFAVCISSAPLCGMAHASDQPVEDVLSAEAEPGLPERPLAWWRYPVAAVEGAAFNVSLNLTVRYIVKEDWAAISLDSIRKNGETGWVWDEDLLATNQFAHPYHGALFHNLGRVHGLTYWETLPLVALGSFEWERYMETDAPSINDQITTTFSGAFFGEVLWKLSGQVLDSSRSGGNRAFREVGAAAINPARGLDRLITGKAWRHGGGTIRVPLKLELAMGVQSVGAHPTLVRARYGLDYGELSLRKPLDVFEGSVEGLVTTGLDEPGVEISVTGGLFGVNAGPHHLLGLFQSYDYVNTPLLTFGATGVGPGWWADAPIGGKWGVSVRWTGMFVPTGAAKSPYALNHTERSYVMGPGGTTSLRLALRHERLGSAFVEGHYFGVYSPIPPRGAEHLGWTSAGLTGKITRRVGLGAQTTVYGVQGLYPNYPAHGTAFVAVRAMATSSF